MASQQGWRPLAEALIAERIACTGLQAFATSLDGHHEIDVAMGSSVGDSMRVDHLHNVYCAAKPLLAIAMGLLFDRHQCGQGSRLVDLTLGRVVDNLNPQATISDALSHSLGLTTPDAVTYRLCPPERRHTLKYSADPAQATAYSDFASWTLLEAIVQSLTAQDPASFVRTEILEPLHLDYEIVVEPSRAMAALAEGRVSVAIGGLPLRPFPFLSELLPSQVQDVRPAFGALASARGLGLLYANLGRVYRGEDVPGLPSPATLVAMLERRRGRIFDRVVQKECDFAGGFMVDLADHRISRTASPAAFGHSSGVINCTALADPTSGVAVAVLLNGAAATLDDLAENRQPLIDALLAEFR